MNHVEKKFDDFKQMMITLSDIESVVTMQTSSEEINKIILQISDMFAEIEELVVAKADGQYVDAIGEAYDGFMATPNDTDEYGKSIHKWVLLSKIGIALSLEKFLLDNQDSFIVDSKNTEEYFRADYMPKRVTAIGLFAIGLHLRLAEPMYSYSIQIDAFRIYPELGQLFNCAYVYDEKKVKDVISDKCPVCGHDKAIPYYNVPQISTLTNGECFSPAKLWMKCLKCENLYAYNFPIFEMGEINGHYAPKEEHIIIKPKHPLNLYSQIINRFKEYTSGRKYLEIGVGNGEMLACALEHGYEVEAVEICKEDCETISTALSVPIVWSDFLKYETDKKYDVIVMGDIIEHVSAPIEALKKAHSLLAPHGILWLSTPNYNSAFSRLMKFEDPMWNQKNHFTYFSYETMVPFFEEEGLEVLRYDISDRYNGSMELYIREK